MDANLSLTFVTQWHVVSSWNAIKLEKQWQWKAIRIIYDGHELGTRKTQWGILHYTLKEHSKMMGIGLCWVNSIRMKESGMDPTLDNQIVRASEIGAFQINGTLCIHVAVDNMIIIKNHSHNDLILTCGVPWPRWKMCLNAEMFKNMIYISHRKHQGFSQQCVFVNGRGM